MVDITLRSVKGSPLTNGEVDANFGNLKAAVENAGGAVRMATEYLTTGTSWTAPASLVGGRARATAVGAGAGGNSGGGVVGNAGAPGGVAVGVFAVNPGDVVPYTIGAPGAAGTSGLGGAGGNTTILGMTASGGPVPATAVQTLLAGGPATGGQLNLVSAIVRSGALSLALGPTPFGRTGLRSGSDTVPASGFGVGGYGGTAPGAQEDGRPGLIVLEYLVSV